MGVRHFRGKLTLLFMVLIGISVIGAGLLAASKLRESHLDSLRDSMIREIRIILATVPWIVEDRGSDRSAYFTEMAVKLRDEAEARVTFIDGDGVVLGDSDHRAQEMDNHLQRPEITKARESGKYGFAERQSETTGYDMLYAALPVKDGESIVGYVRLAAPLAAVRGHIAGLWSYLVTGFCILLLAAGVISYRVARGIAKPLDNITQVANEITNANFETRVKVSGRDEFGQLGRSINKMAASLQDQMRLVRENEHRLANILDHLINGVILIDSDGRIRLLNPSAEQMLGMTSSELQGQRFETAHLHSDLMRVLQDALVMKESVREEIVVYYPQERTIEIHVVLLDSTKTEQAGTLVIMHDISEMKRLENVRSQFVANVSHELKTPVAAIQGFAETLLSGALEDRETLESFLHIIHEESERLDRLISDILELSKIESKRAALYFSPIQLDEFIDKTLHVVQPEVAQKQIRIFCDVPGDAFIEADEDRLRQIVLNLLTNAINYTPEGGTVTISVQFTEHGPASKEVVRLSIRDTGIGIPKKDVPRIFERFYRVDKARSRSSGGTGLGLSIVKHLVELHKGTIDVTSEVGAGTEFVITLPVIQDEEGA